MKEAVCGNEADTVGHVKMTDVVHPYYNHSTQFILYEILIQKK